MSYKLETRTTSNQSSRGSYGYSSKPTGITIHWWGSPSAGATHAGVVSWLRGRAGGTSNRGSSAHYVVSAGRVTKLPTKPALPGTLVTAKVTAQPLALRCIPGCLTGTGTPWSNCARTLKNGTGRSRIIVIPIGRPPRVL